MKMCCLTPLLTEARYNERARLTPRNLERFEKVTMNCRWPFNLQAKRAVQRGIGRSSLTENYRRLFHRWEVLRGWVPAIIFAVLSIGIELFFLEYLDGLGFVNIKVGIPVGPWSVPVSMALVLSLGVVVVLVSLWLSVFESVAYVKTGPSKEVRRILYPLRMVRMAALVLTPFTFLLFTPYVLQSGSFLGYATSTSALQGLGTTIYNWSLDIGQLDFSTRFILSQLIATLGTVVVGALQIWRVRGARNLMLMLRRRKR